MVTGHATERAPAKVNLHLRIVAREPDGYHALETLFQAIELHDTLEARAAAAMTLDVAGDIDVGPVDANLVLRAARAFRSAVPEAPVVAFRLTKRIPVGAGLGGGSSDAAAALRALNALAPRPLSAEALRELGATIGADVAFFLCGSPLAWATGRGDRLESHAPLPSAPVLVVQPAFSVLTREAFGWWDAREQSATEGVDAFYATDRVGTLPETRTFDALRGLVTNDFETVVFERHPLLARIRDSLAAAGATLAMLSGSGSCVYGLFDSDAQADAAREAVLGAAPNARVLVTRTLT